MRKIKTKSEFPVYGWRKLQDESLHETNMNIVWLVAMITMAFIFPVLAWSEVYKIPVIKGNVTKGSIITAGDIEVKSMELKHLNPNIITSKNDLIGMELNRNVRAGYPIYTSHVRVPPTVHKNGVVQTVFTASGIEILGTAKVLQDALAGQSVKVMNVTSGKVIAGLVMPDGRVKVQ